MNKPLAILILAVLFPALYLAFTLGGRIDDGAVQLDAVSTSEDRHGDIGLYAARVADRTPPNHVTTTTEAPKPKARTAPKHGTSPYPTDELLDALAYCETGGTMDPATNTGNGYYGAFQFSIGTWWSVGGEGYPHEHPYGVQRDLARTLILQAGWGQFPTCSRTIGAR